MQKFNRSEGDLSMLSRIKFGSDQETVKATGSKANQTTSIFQTCPKSHAVPIPQA